MARQELIKLRLSNHVGVKILIEDQTERTISDKKKKEIEGTEERLGKIEKNGDVTEKIVKDTGETMIENAKGGDKVKQI